MKRLLKLGIIAFVAMCENGCAISSHLHVTNSVSLSQANFEIVKPLSKTITSKHILCLGGRQVREAKERVINDWQKSLRPNQALANIYFTESYSHFIYWVIYEEAVTISAVVVEFKSDQNNDAKTNNNIVSSPSQQRIIHDYETPEQEYNNLSIPISIREFSLMNGKKIAYDDCVPIEKQLLNDIEEIKSAYQSYSLKTAKLKDNTLANVSILKQWYSLSGIKSSVVDSAFEDLLTLVK